MIPYFTIHEIENLEIEFKLLNTIEDKFKFWLERLKTPFCLWSEGPFDIATKFMIRVDNEIDIEKINKMMLVEYSQRFDLLSSKKKIYQLERVKEDFLKRYDQAQNGKRLIEQEISSLIERVRLKDGIIDDHTQNTGSFFEGGYMQDEEPDLKSNVLEIENLIALVNGYTLVQYRLFLDELVNKPIEKDIEYTLVEQILILNYLGIAKHIKTDMQKAGVFAPIIRRSPEKIRQQLTKIRIDTKEKNLNIVFDYFNKNGFADQAQEVKKEIFKLSKKK